MKNAFVSYFWHHLLQDPFKGLAPIKEVKGPDIYDLILSTVLSMAKIVLSLMRFCSVSPGSMQGAQWLNGRVLDSRWRGRGFEPRRRHSVVVREQDTFILA